MSILIHTEIEFDIFGASAPNWITYQIWNLQEWELFTKLVKEVKEISVSIGNSPTEAYFEITSEEMLKNSRICSKEELDAYRILYKKQQWTNLYNIFDEFLKKLKVDFKTIAKERNILKLARPIYELCEKLEHEDDDSYVTIIEKYLGDVGFNVMFNYGIRFFVSAEERQRLAERRAKRIYDLEYSMSRSSGFVNDQPFEDYVNRVLKEWNQVKFTDHDEFLQQLQDNGAKVREELLAFKPQPVDK